MAAPSAKAPVIPHGGWSYDRLPANNSATQNAPLSEVVIDPYAPRRDAPVYRLQSGTAAEPVTNSPSSSDGVRYYSVHRQAGRQADAVQIPVPVYLDALPVILTSPVSSEDLAAPPPVPQMMRDANGRVRAVADLEDPA